MRVSFHTLGCRLNQAEEEALRRQFMEAGHTISRHEHSDLAIVNTCSVTTLADKKSRQAIRSIRSKNKGIHIFVIGCGAEKAKEYPEVDLWIPSKDKSKVFDIINSKYKSQDFKYLKKDAKSSFGNNVYGVRNDPGALAVRTRALLKIQDGCNNFCSYCIVPKLRGGEVSCSVESIISEAKNLEKMGYKELVLSGVNVGRYAFKYKNQNDKIKSVASLMQEKKEKIQDNGLTKLIEMLLAETSFPRIRLSSINPQDVTVEMIELWAKNPRLCRHLHLSLQNGSNNVLKKMGRPYTRESYLKLCNKITQKIPGIAITTDVIVGFPGETENDFFETLDLVDKVGFAKLHVFRYSKRAGTKAATMAKQIPEDIKKRRAATLSELGRNLHNKYVQEFLEREVTVLFEEKKDGIWFGLSDNYLRVGVRSKFNVENQIFKTRLFQNRNGYIKGEIVEN